MTDIPNRAFSMDFEQHQALIHKFARKGYGRLVQANVIIDYEDVYQEMCVTFTLALSKYDPSKGISFSAYFGRAIWHQFNRFAEREIQEKVDICSASIDDMASSGEDDSKMDFYEVVDSGQPSPEEILSSRQEAMERNAKCRSTVSKIFIRELMNPSKKVLDALAQQEEEIKGIDGRRANKEVGLQLIADAYGISNKDAKAAKKQLNKIYGLKIMLR